MLPPDSAASGSDGGVPRPGRWAMLWLLLRFPRNPAMVYRDVRARYGDTVWLRDLSGNEWLFIARPQDVLRVHRTNNRGYGRGSLNEPFAAFLGQGLLTSERDTWARHHRLLAPAFRGPAVARFVQAAGPYVLELVGDWAARRGTQFDICPDLELLSYRATASGMFGLGSHDEQGTLVALNRALEHVSRESFRMIGRPRWLGAVARRRFRHDLGVLDELVRPAIAGARQHDGEAEGNLLGLMVGAGQQLIDDEIRDEMVTMLHAGQHTVASGLAFALHLIASHPRVQAELAAEVAPLGQPLPSFDELASLPRLEAAIGEALRLYPPAWGGVREALADDELGGVTIGAGTPVVFSQFVTHRDPALWEDAEEFCPHRADRAAGGGDFRYFPFGGGPHLCIGKDMALLLMKLVLAAVLSRFELRPVPGRTVRPKAMLDLIPSGGVHLALANRAG